jgi:hypothetical protein
VEFRDVVYMLAGVGKDHTLFSQPRE